MRLQSGLVGGRQVLAELETGDGWLYYQGLSKRWCRYCLSFLEKDPPSADVLKSLLNELVEDQLESAQLRMLYVWSRLKD